LATSYLGLELGSPLVPSASPLSKDLDVVRRLEDAGAAALVLYSLFEEEIAQAAATLHRSLEQGRESFPESLSYLPEPDASAFGPHEYLDHLRRVKEAVDIPVIGSLNASNLGGWVEYARYIEQADADALELNIYRIAADPRAVGRKVEEEYLQIVEAVRRTVSIPLALKLSPYLSSMTEMADRLANAGADALVLFNRFYQPDIDLDQLGVVPSLELSTSWEGRLVTRWIALLYGRVRANLAATTGIHTSEDVLKMILAGADVAMLCSVLLQRGPEHLEVLRKGVLDWLEEQEYNSVAQIRGILSHRTSPNPAAFERAHYIEALRRWI
jgi:dihydroorotate dehydrogenase (fumarate)